MNKLQLVWAWTLRSAYRTWIAHCLLGLLLAPIFGAWTIAVFYILREIEQVFTQYLDGIPFAYQDWGDHFLDLSAPFVALGLASLAGWGA
jgi:hypothetical protein